MADDIDRAQERDVLLLEAQLMARKPEGPSPTGQCLSCEEIIPHPMRWCDADCRDDYDRTPHHFRR